MKLITNGTPISPKGFTASAVVAGLKQSGNLDLTIVASDTDCTAAGSFTTSMVVAAPVVVSRDTVQANANGIRGVVVNAGIANACTGQQGHDNTVAMQSATAQKMGCDADQILVMSTGVIGVQLPMDKVNAGILASTFSRDNGESSAHAIMTTDSRPKHLAVEVQLPSGVVTIGGMAKGSGMIHPNMATMLALVTTDAGISHPQPLLTQAVNQSFNCISVDGDTSTNDTVLFLANGASGVTLGEADIEPFAQALTFVCGQLAKMIVRDGEGVTKFVTIRVSGTADDGSAKQIANTIATSPLVKTAFAGSDPNWGRILAAAGRAGIFFDQHQTFLTIQSDSYPLQLLANGTPTAFDDAMAGAIFSEPEFNIHLRVGDGDGRATVWTGDLTHDYITINADYRT